MSTPENEAAAAPDRSSSDAEPAQSTPIGENVEHHHDITDDDLPADLQPTDDNPLAQGPEEGEDVSAFEPRGRVDGGEDAGASGDDGSET